MRVHVLLPTQLRHPIWWHKDCHINPICDFVLFCRSIAAGVQRKPSTSLQHPSSSQLSSARQSDSSNMRASSSRSCKLVLAALFIALCSAQHAAAARSTGRQLRQAEPAGKGAKKQKPLAPHEIMAVAASTGALLPACVPKYVTDLVIPPPMPVTTQPLTEVSVQPPYEPSLVWDRGFRVNGSRTAGQAGL